ncbi:type II toxin-antitoxin system antitoxin SocA domain-containing protein [Nostoc sp.]
MTNMKVQKLLYYAQSLHLAIYDQPLFEAEIQALALWPCLSSGLQVLQ